MYDKYQTGNSFGINVKLPKMKGMAIFGSNPTAGGTASFYLVNDQGNTFPMSIHFMGGLNILPMQVHTVTSLFAGGQTGMYLN